MILSHKKCVPCDAGGEKLFPDAAHTLLAQLEGWNISQDNAWLHKSYTFKNFVQSLAFVNKIGEVAEAEGHHPDLTLGWGYVEIKLQTHAIGGLHVNDFIVAAKIDALSI